MNDLKFMFTDDKGDISNKIESEITKKTKKEGIKSDILKIAGGLPSMMPVNTNQNKEKKRQKWIWSEFTNPARIDGLRLSHWQRIEDIKKEYEYAQLNKTINIVNIRKEEYFQVCEDLDPTWDWEETDYLWDLCRTYDLRFIVIHDRYNYTDINGNSIDRSIEDLKERYYSVCRKILEIRKNYDHPIIKSGYCYEQEIKRRACLDRIINKNNEQQALETEIIDQANEIKEKIEKIQKFDKLEKKLIKHVEDQDLADGTFEDYIKNKPFTDNTFAYLRSYKLSHPPPINEKIQKKVEIMMKELGVPEKPMPTERVEFAFDTLKNNLIIMTSLKKHLEKKDFDKKKLEQSLFDIQSRINNINKSSLNNISNANNNNSNLLNTVNENNKLDKTVIKEGGNVGGSINNNSIRKDKKIKLINHHNNTNIGNNRNIDGSNIKPKKKKITNEEESKTEASIKKKKKINNFNNGANSMSQSKNEINPHLNNNVMNVSSNRV